MRSFKPFFASAVALSFVAVSSTAIGYTFLNVADTNTSAPSGTFTGFDRYETSINHGTVAFYGYYNSGNGVFAGSGGTLATIAKTGDPSPDGPFSGFSGVSISDGVVAVGGYYYHNSPETYPSGIFTGNGGELTTIARKDDSAPIGTFRAFSNTSLSGDVVAFEGYYNSIDYGVFVATAGSLTTIVKRGDAAPTGTFEGGFSGLSLDNGNVAFNGIYNLNADGIFVGNGSMLTTIAKQGDAAPIGTFTTFFSPSLSGDSTVAFSAAYNGWQGSGVFLSSEGSLTNIAKRGDPAPVGTFLSFDSVSLSGDDVIFRAYYNDSIEKVGVFMSDGASLNTIIKTGDPLFGSKVTDLSFGNRGLDEAGNVAFWYQLADGRTGVAIAAVPEPNALILLGIAGFGLLGYRRQRRKQAA